MVYKCPECGTHTEEASAQITLRGKTIMKFSRRCNNCKWRGEEDVESCGAIFILM